MAASTPAAVDYGKPMRKMSKSLSLGFVLALICLPPLHAQPPHKKPANPDPVPTQTPADSNPAADSAPASQAPDKVTNLPPLHAQTTTSAPSDTNATATPARAGQAPDEMTKKISDLVHAGKYAEAQQLTTGLLVAYPDDQRLIKAKALLEKLLATSPNETANGSQSTNNAAPAQPAATTSAEQLKGMDKLDYSALIELAREAQQTTDPSQQNTLLRQFMEGSGKFLRKHPNEMLLWQLRAASAISLNAPRAGYEAGRKLLEAGAADSNDPNLQRLIAQLKNKGWLDRQQAEQLEVSIRNEQTRAWASAEAARLRAEDLMYTFPTRHMRTLNWGYGHLTIAENDFVYDGSDGHIQFSKNEIREITVNGGVGGLKFILKDRKTFVFVVITEASVANQKGPEALSVTGIGNAVAARWRFVASADSKTLRPPAP
jgi:hypothetical protein